MLSPTSRIVTRVRGQVLVLSGSLWQSASRYFRFSGSVDGNGTPSARRLARENKWPASPPNLTACRTCQPPVTDGEQNGREGTRAGVGTFGAGSIAMICASESVAGIRDALVAIRVTVRVAAS